MKTNLFIASGLCAVLMLSVCGCYEDPLYTNENLDNIDTDIEIFQNGLEIPLGSSAKIRVDSLLQTMSLDTLVGEYLKVDEDGNYYLHYEGAQQLDDIISSFGGDSLVSMGGLEFKKVYKRSTGNIDLSSLSIPAKSFGNPVTLGNFASVTDVEIPDLKGIISEVKAGFPGKSFSIGIDAKGVSESIVVASKNSINTIGSIAALQGKTGSVAVSSIKDITFDPISQQIPATTLPDGVKAVKSVKLKSGAGIKFEFSMSGSSILTGGTFTPNVVADLSKVLKIKDSGGTVDLSELVLNSANSYKNSKVYEVSSVNLETICQDRELSLEGKIEVDGISVNVASASAATEDLKVNVTVSFVNFEIDDFSCELDGISFERTVNTEFSAPVFNIPSQVKKIESITFTDNSEFKFQINPMNLNKMSGIEMTIDELVIDFPKGYTISGANVVDNRFVLKNTKLTGPINKSVRIVSATLPDPVDGRIAADGKASIYVKASATGTISSSQFPKVDADDISVRTDVNGNLKIKDFSVRTAKIEQDLSVAAQKISIELPSSVGNTFGKFKVIPDGNPSLNIDMQIPDLGNFSFNTGEGIVIELPALIQFGTIAPELNFNEAKHTITITDVKTQSFSLPIEALNVVPFKNEFEKYVIEGTYGVSGKIVAPEALIDKSTLQKISGSNFNFSVSIPAMQAKSIELENLELAFGDTYDYTIIHARDIPEQLKTVGKIRLDDVAADLEFSVKGLPDIGQGSYNVDFLVTLPEYISPKTIQIKGEISNQAPLKISQTIDGFDFSSFDLDAMRAADDSLCASIGIDGSVAATNPTVDLSTLEASVAATVKVKIGNKKSRIEVKSLEAFVGYDIDTTVCIPFIGDIIGDNLNLDIKGIGLPEVNCSIDLESNIGVPMYASAVATPFNSNGVYYTDCAISFNDDGNFKIPYSIDPSVFDKTHNELNLNIEKLASTMADSVELALKAGINKNRLCYIEPAANYQLKMNYELNAPIQFGSGLDISLNDICFDVDSSMMSVLRNVSFGLALKVDNHLPFGVGLEACFVDEFGNVLPCSKSGTINPVLKADEVSDVTVSFEPQDGVDLMKARQIRISFNLNAAARQLRPDDYIQILSAVVKLEQGVVISSDILNNYTSDTIQ